MNMKKKLRQAATLLPLVAAIASINQAQAGFTDDFGRPTINWNNTVKYNMMYRVADQDSSLLAGAQTNGGNFDDGNANFDKGVVSNRIELLTELDVIGENGFGGRVSALGYYDTVYNSKNDNPGFAGGAFPNHISESYNEFTDDTREVHGRDIELRDAFLFGRFMIGDSPLRFRLGQYSLVWGESLFFANNAIAGAQNGFDINRLMGDPTAEAKEFVLPVPQLSAELQLNQDISVAAYYQFDHEPNQLPAVGSYFSTNDSGVDGAEQLLLGPGLAANRTGTLDADNSGQFGLQVRWRLEETDLGFYVVRFHDKGYQQVIRLGAVPGVGVLPVSYYHTYHQDTTAYGFSASRSFNSVNLAMEASIRKDQSLASSGHAVDASALNPMLVASDNKDNPAYAVGDTAHLNLSAIWTVPRTALWEEANFIGEIAWNRLLDCNQSCEALDPNASRDAIAFRGVFEPTYRQVIPGLDLSVPIGIGYSPKGSRSSMGPGFPVENGGDFTIGLNGVYMGTWEISAAYTNFFGEEGLFFDEGNSFSYQQSLDDRDFFALTVRRSF